MLLMIAICILMYADGVVKDEYNIAIDGIRLNQNLLIIVIYIELFIGLRSVLNSRFIMTIILVLFIPVSFYSIVTISMNTVTIKNIIAENEYSKTGIKQIHLPDLKEALAAPSYPLDVTVIEEAIHQLQRASPRIKNPGAGSLYGIYNTIILQ